MELTNSPPKKSYPKSEMVVSVHNPASIKELFDDISETTAALQDKLSTMMKLKDRLHSDIQFQMDELDKVRRKLMSDADAKDDEKKVSFNVGGTIFSTYLSTVNKEPSLLSALVSGKYAHAVDEKGEIFLDRDPKYFGMILNYLRKGTLPPFADMKKPEKKELKEEIKYYGVVSLIDALNPSTHATDVSFGTSSLPDGIFQWLGTNGFSTAFTNPVTLGLVNVVSAGSYSFTDSTLVGKMLFEKNWRLNTASSYASSTTNTPTDFVFTKHMVRLTQYYIYCSYSGYDPKNWTIYGVNADNSTDLLYTHSNESSANIKGHIWSINSDKFYNTYRFTPGNPCTATSSQQWVLNYIEFAGEIMTNEDYNSMNADFPRRKK